MLCSWNCSTFPVWLWTSHVSQSLRPGAKPLVAPNQVLICLFGQGWGFRSLGFDIQGWLFFFFFNKSLVHMSQPYGIPGRQASCLNVNLGVNSLYKAQQVGTRFSLNHFHLWIKKIQQRNSISSGSLGNPLVPGKCKTEHFYSTSVDRP